MKCTSANCTFAISTYNGYSGDANPRQSDN